MADPRGRQWTIELQNGRKVAVGAGVDEDRGAWILNPDSELLRWLTSSDAERIGQALFEAAAHLAQHPTEAKPRRRRARR